MSIEDLLLRKEKVIILTVLDANIEELSKLADEIEEQTSVNKKSDVGIILFNKEVNVFTRTKKTFNKAEFIKYLSSVGVLDNGKT